MGITLIFFMCCLRLSYADIQIGSVSDQVEARLVGAEKKLDILKLEFQSLTSLKRLGPEKKENPIVLAQSSVGDLQLRLNTVEQQLRIMTGQLEQLQYQMQQMQQQFQNYAQDSEYRFQQLEGSQASEFNQQAPAVPQVTTPDALPENFDRPDDFLDEDAPLDLRNIFKDSSLDIKEKQDGVKSTPIRLAEDFIKQGDFKKAQDYLTMLNDGDLKQDEQVEKLYLLGVSQYELSDYSEAINTLLRSYKLSNEKIKENRVLIKLAQAMNVVGERETACSMVDRIFQNTNHSQSSLVAEADFLGEGQALYAQLNCG